MAERYVGHSAADVAMLEKRRFGAIDGDQTAFRSDPIGCARLMTDEMHAMVLTAPGAPLRFERRREANEVLAKRRAGQIIGAVLQP
jgi:hypothetical protein